MTEFCFGRWQLVPGRRKLMADGQPVVIGGRAFDLLAGLVEARGAIVPKPDLLRRVWPGSLVDESNLQVQVSTLRKVFGQDDAWMIVNVPGRGYRFAGELGPAAATGVTPGPRPVRPDRPSVAVLAFRNLGSDPTQDYFADGIADELTTALSRFGWLFVIARNSSFAFKNRAIDVARIGEELGVRYVIDGSVRRANGQVRIAAQLMEAASRLEIWADRFDGGDQDIFALQDQVSASIASAIGPRVREAETTRARAKPTGQLGAYDHYLRALWHLSPRTEENYAQALAQFDRAIALDPRFALAIAMASQCRVSRRAEGWASGQADDEAVAVQLAERALSLAADQPEVLAHAGHTLGFCGQGLPGAIQLVERAVVLNPNMAFGWWANGWLHLQQGDPEPAIAHFARALRLSPLDVKTTTLAKAATANALLLCGRDAEAIVWATQAVRQSADFAYAHRVLVAALAKAGRLEDATMAGRAILRIEPGFTVSGYVSRVALRDTLAVQVMVEGLRLANMP